jgi:hypothetical protein
MSVMVSASLRTFVWPKGLGHVEIQARSRSEKAGSTVSLAS